MKITNMMRKNRIISSLLAATMFITSTPIEMMAQSLKEVDVVFSGKADSENSFEEVSVQALPKIDNVTVKQITLPDGTTVDGDKAKFTAYKNGKYEINVIYDKTVDTILPQENLQSESTEIQENSEENTEEITEKSSEESSEQTTIKNPTEEQIDTNSTITEVENNTSYVPPTDKNDDKTKNENETTNNSSNNIDLKQNNVFAGYMTLLNSIKSETEPHIYTKTVQKTQKFIYTVRSIKDNSGIAPQSYESEIYSIDFPEITSEKSFDFDENTNTITKFIGNEKQILIPNTINGAEVLKIGKDAFKGANIEQIVIPNGIQSIGDFAFAESTLEKIYISNSVFEIGKGAFKDNKQLKTAKMPEKLKTFSDEIFKNSENLKNINIPNELEIIGNSAFENTGIEQIIITAKTIGKRAFKDTKKLKAAYLSQSITNIPESLFEGSSITHITIPEDTQKIEQKAFANSKLENVYLPKYTNIDATAFDGTNPQFAIEDVQKIATLDGKNVKYLDDMIQINLNTKKGKTDYETDINVNMKSGKNVKISYMTMYTGLGVLVDSTLYDYTASVNQNGIYTFKAEDENGNIFIKDAAVIDEGTPEMTLENATLEKGKIYTEKELKTALMIEAKSGLGLALDTYISEKDIDRVNAASKTGSDVYIAVASYGGNSVRIIDIAKINFNSEKLHNITIEVPEIASAIPYTFMVTENEPIVKSRRRRSIPTIPTGETTAIVPEGLYKDENLKNKVNLDTFKAKEDVTLYAKVDETQNYNAKFYNFDGSLVYDETVEKDKILNGMQVARYGYGFDGWIDQSGKFYPRGQSIPITKNNMKFTPVYKTIHEMRQDAIERAKNDPTILIDEGVGKYDNDGDENSKGIYKWEDTKGGVIITDVDFKAVGKYSEIVMPEQLGGKDVVEIGNTNGDENDRVLQLNVGDKLEAVFLSPKIHTMKYNSVGYEYKYYDKVYHKSAPNRYLERLVLSENLKTIEDLGINMNGVIYGKPDDNAAYAKSRIPMIIKEIIFPNTLEKVGNQGILGSSGKAMSLPPNTKLENQAIRHSLLTYLELPKNLEVLKDNVIDVADNLVVQTALKTIDLPEGLKKLGNITQQRFDYLLLPEGLEEITSTLDTSYKPRFDKLQSTDLIYFPSTIKNKSSENIFVREGNVQRLFVNKQRSGEGVYNAPKDAKVWWQGQFASLDEEKITKNPDDYNRRDIELLFNTHTENKLVNGDEKDTLITKISIPQGVVLDEVIDGNTGKSLTNATDYTLVNETGTLSFNENTQKYTKIKLKLHTNENGRHRFYVSANNKGFLATGGNSSEKNTDETAKNSNRMIYETIIDDIGRVEITGGNDVKMEVTSTTTENDIIQNIAPTVTANGTYTLMLGDGDIERVRNLKIGDSTKVIIKAINQAGQEYSSNRTYIVTSKGITHAVTFKDFNGQVIENVPISNKKIAEVPSAAKVDNVFLGWKDEKTGELFKTKKELLDKIYSANTSFVPVFEHIRENYYTAYENAKDTKNTDYVIADSTNGTVNGGTFTVKTGQLNSKKILVIPEKLETKQNARTTNNEITKVDLQGLKNTQIEEVYLPNSVTEIADNSFKDNKTIKKVVLGSKVTKIGANAFSGATKLEQVAIPSSLENVGENAFKGTNSLKSIDFGGLGLVLKHNVTAKNAEVLTFGANAFENSGIQNVFGLGNATKISDSMFKGSKLKDIKITEKITQVGSNAFDKSNVKMLVLPKNVTTIGANAFDNMANLETLTIPKTLTNTVSINNTPKAKVENLSSANVTGGNEVYDNNKLATVKMTKTTNNNRTKIKLEAEPINKDYRIKSVTLPVGVIVNGIKKEEEFTQNLDIAKYESEFFIDGNGEYLFKFAIGDKEGNPIATLHSKVDLSKEVNLTYPTTQNDVEIEINGKTTANSVIKEINKNTNKYKIEIDGKEINLMFAKGDMENITALKENATTKVLIRATYNGQSIYFPNKITIKATKVTKPKYVTFEDNMGNIVKVVEAKKTATTQTAKGQAAAADTWTVPEAEIPYAGKVGYIFKEWVENYDKDTINIYDEPNKAKAGTDEKNKVITRDQIKNKTFNESDFKDDYAVITAVLVDATEAYNKAIEYAKKPVTKAKGRTLAQGQADTKKVLVLDGDNLELDASGKIQNVKEKTTRVAGEVALNEADVVVIPETIKVNGSGEEKVIKGIKDEAGFDNQGNKFKNSGVTLFVPGTVKSVDSWGLAQNKFENIVFLDGLETVQEDGLNQTGAKQIVFPHTLKTLVKEAIRKANKLESLYLPDNVDIGWAALYGTSIKTVIAGKNTENVGTKTEIGWNGSNTMNDVYMGQNSEFTGDAAALINTKLEKVYIDKSGMGKRAIEGNKVLEELYIPNASINGDAFSGFNTGNNKLTKDYKIFINVSEKDIPNPVKNQGTIKGKPSTKTADKKATIYPKGQFVFMDTNNYTVRREENGSYKVKINAATGSNTLTIDKISVNGKPILYPGTTSFNKEIDVEKGGLNQIEFVASDGTTTTYPIMINGVSNPTINVKKGESKESPAAIKVSSNLTKNDILKALEVTTSSDTKISISDADLDKVKNATDNVVEITLTAEKMHGFANKVTKKVWLKATKYYDVTVKDYDGSVIYKESVKQNETLSQDIIGSRASYIFDSYVDEKDKIVKDISKEKINKDTTFTATYTDVEDAYDKAIAKTDFEFKDTDLKANGELSGKPKAKGLFRGNDKVLVIPRKIGNKEVTSLKNIDLTGIKTVFVPTTVKEVNKDSFKTATAAKTNSTVEKIYLSSFTRTVGDDTFKGMDKLKEVTLSINTKSVGKNAFEGTKALINVDLGEGLTKIEDNTFKNSGLKLVRFSNKVTSIGKSAFENSGLIDINLRKETTSIGDNAFKGSKLKNVYIPEGVTTIEKGAFAEITTLENIYIPETATAAEILSPATGVTKTQANKPNVFINNLNGEFVNTTDKGKYKIYHGRDYPAGKATVTGDSKNKKIKLEVSSGQVIEGMQIPASLGGEYVPIQSKTYTSKEIPVNKNGVYEFVFTSKKAKDDTNSNANNDTKLYTTYRVVIDDMNHIKIEEKAPVTRVEKDITTVDLIEKIATFTPASGVEITAKSIYPSIDEIRADFEKGQVDVKVSAIDKNGMSESKIITIKSREIAKFYMGDYDFAEMDITGDTENMVKPPYSDRAGYLIDWYKDREYKQKAELVNGKLKIEDNKSANFYGKYVSIQEKYDELLKKAWDGTNTNNNSIDKNIIKAKVTVDNNGAIKEIKRPTLPQAGTGAATEIDLKGKTLIVPNEGTLAPSNKTADTAGSATKVEVKSMPNNVTVSDIKDKGLEWLYLPKGVTVIQNGVLKQKNIAKNIVLGSETTEIQAEAFKEDTKIEQVVMPTTLKTIGYSVFQKARNLKSLVMPKGAKITTGSGNAGLVENGGLEQIHLPAKVNTGFYGLKANANLKKITFDEGITEIHKQAFANNPKLERIYLPKSVTKIGENIFADKKDSGVKEIHIQSNATIDNNAFSKVNSAKIFINAPKTSKKYGAGGSTKFYFKGEYANLDTFIGKENVNKNSYDVTIKASTGSDLKISKIYADGIVTEIETPSNTISQVINVPEQKLYKLTLETENGVKTNYDMDIRKPDGKVKLTVPKTTIDMKYVNDMTKEEVLSNIKYSTKSDVGEVEVTFSDDDMKRIKETATNSTVKINLIARTKISIPVEDKKEVTLKITGKQREITYLDYDESIIRRDFIDENSSVDKAKAPHVSRAGYVFTGFKLKTDNFIDKIVAKLTNGNEVYIAEYKSIDDVVKEHNIDLKTAYTMGKINSKTATQGEIAANETLKSVTNSAVVTIGSEKVIIIPSEVYTDNTDKKPVLVRKIDKGAFSSLDKANITQVAIAPTVTEIGESAFDGMGIKSIDLGQINKVGKNAFKGTKIKNVVIPKSLKIVEDSLFEGATELESMYIEDGVTTLGSKIINGTKVKKMVIPTSVANVTEAVKANATAVFAGAKELETVYIDGNSANALKDKYIFDNANSTKLTVYADMAKPTTVTRTAATNFGLNDSNKIKYKNDYPEIKSVVTDAGTEDTIKLTIKAPTNTIIESVKSPEHTNSNGIIIEKSVNSPSESYEPSITVNKNGAYTFEVTTKENTPKAADNQAADNQSVAPKTTKYEYTVVVNNLPNIDFNVEENLRTTKQNINNFILENLGSAAKIGDKLAMIKIIGKPATILKARNAKNNDKIDVFLKTINPDNNAEYYKHINVTMQDEVMFKDKYNIVERKAVDTTTTRNQATATTTVTPPIMAKIGYIFDGWYKDEQLQEKDKVELDSNGKITIEPTTQKNTDHTKSEYTYYAKWTSIQDKYDALKDENDKNKDGKDDESDNGIIYGKVDSTDSNKQLVVNAEGVVTQLPNVDKINNTDLSTNNRMTIIIPETVEVDGKQVTVKDIKLANVRQRWVDTLYLPKTITKIQDNAFKDDNAGNFINKIVLGSKTTKIGNSAFQFNKIEEIIMPSTVKEIGYSVFNKSDKLKTLVLPENIKTYERTGKAGLLEANENQGSLQKLHFSRNVNPGYYGFKNHSNLKKVTFDEGITDIYDEVFADSNNIEMIHFPKSVTKIGKMIFANKKDSNIKNIYVQSEANINDNAFNRVNKANIFINMPDKGKRYGAGADAKLYFKGEYANLDNYIVTKNEIKNKTKGTSEQLYKVSLNLNTYNEKLKIVKAFMNGEDITGKNKPSSQMTLAADVMAQTNKLILITENGVKTKFNIEIDGNQNLDIKLESPKNNKINEIDVYNDIADSTIAEKGGYTAKVTYEGGEDIAPITITSGKENLLKAKQGEIVPLKGVAQYTRNGVTAKLSEFEMKVKVKSRVYYNTYKNYNGEQLLLMSGNDSNTQEIAGMTASRKGHLFTGFDKKEDGGDNLYTAQFRPVTDGETSRSVEYLDYSPIDNGLEVRIKANKTPDDGIVIIPEIYNGMKVIKIADNGFKDTKKIKQFVMNNNITEIGKNAFNGSSIESIDLTNIETIGEGAFANSKLQSVQLGDKVKQILKDTFKNSELKEVRLAKVTAIGESAFENTQLKNLELTSNVTYIRPNAFANIKTLEEATINGKLMNEKTVKIFGDNPSIKTLNVNMAKPEATAKATTPATKATIYGVAEDKVKFNDTKMFVTEKSIDKQNREIKLTLSMPNAANSTTKEEVSVVDINKGTVTNEGNELTVKYDQNGKHTITVNGKYKYNIYVSGNGNVTLNDKNITINMPENKTNLSKDEITKLLAQSINMNVQGYEKDAIKLNLTDVYLNKFKNTKNGETSQIEIQILDQSPYKFTTNIKVDVKINNTNNIYFKGVVSNNVNVDLKELNPEKLTVKEFMQKAGVSAEVDTQTLDAYMLKSDLEKIRQIENSGKVEIELIAINTKFVNLPSINADGTINDLKDIDSKYYKKQKVAIDVSNLKPLELNITAPTTDVEIVLEKGKQAKFIEENMIIISINPSVTYGNEDVTKDVEVKLQPDDIYKIRATKNVSVGVTLKAEYKGKVATLPVFVKVKETEVKIAMGDGVITLDKGQDITTISEQKILEKLNIIAKNSEGNELKLSISSKDMEEIAKLKDKGKTNIEIIIKNGEEILKKPIIITLNNTNNKQDIEIVDKRQDKLKPDTIKIVKGEYLSNLTEKQILEKMDVRVNINDTEISDAIAKGILKFADKNMLNEIRLLKDKENIAVRLEAQTTTGNDVFIAKYNIPVQIDNSQNKPNIKIRDVKKPAIIKLDTFDDISKMKDGEIIKKAGIEIEVNGKVPSDYSEIATITKGIEKVRLMKNNDTAKITITATKKYGNDVYTDEKEVEVKLDSSENSKSVKISTPSNVIMKMDNGQFITQMSEAQMINKIGAKLIFGDTTLNEEQGTPAISIYKGLEELQKLEDGKSAIISLKAVKKIGNDIATAETNDIKVTLDNKINLSKVEFKSSALVIRVAKGESVINSTKGITEQKILDSIQAYVNGKQVMDVDMKIENSEKISAEIEKLKEHKDSANFSVKGTRKAGNDIVEVKGQVSVIIDDTKNFNIKISQEKLTEDDFITITPLLEEKDVMKKLKVTADVTYKGKEIAKNILVALKDGELDKIKTKAPQEVLVIAKYHDPRFEDQKNLIVLPEPEQMVKIKTHRPDTVEVNTFNDYNGVMLDKNQVINGEGATTPSANRVSYIFTQFNEIEKEQIFNEAPVRKRSRRRRSAQPRTSVINRTFVSQYEPAYEKYAEHSKMFNVTEDGVVTLKEEARKSLPKVVVIPDIIGETKVLKVGKNAFKDTKIEQVSLPKTVYAIGEGAFENTPIRAIDLQNTNIIEKNAFKNTKLERVDIQNVQNISDSSFEAVETLKTAIIGKGVETVGNSAFKGTSLEKVIIPEGVTNVGADAFATNGTIYEAHIPSTLKPSKMFGKNVDIKEIFINQETIRKDDWGINNNENIVINTQSQILVVTGDKVTKNGRNREITLEVQSPQNDEISFATINGNNTVNTEQMGENRYKMTATVDKNGVYAFDIYTKNGKTTRYSIIIDDIGSIEISLTDGSVEKGNTSEEIIKEAMGLKASVDGVDITKETHIPKEVIQKVQNAKVGEKVLVVAMAEHNGISNVSKQSVLTIEIKEEQDSSNNSSIGGGSSGAQGGKILSNKEEISKEKAKEKEEKTKEKELKIDIKLPEKSEKAKQFDDISNHWANGYIEELTKMGVINGYPDGSFKPNSNIKRADITIMITKLLGMKPKSNMASFVDVDVRAYYASYISIAKQYGIVNGYDGKFNPDSSIKREDMIVMVANILRELGLENREEKANKVEFKDTNTVSEYAKESVEMLSKYGIVIGDENQMLQPKEEITRAETAVVVQKVYNLIEKEQKRKEEAKKQEAKKEEAKKQEKVSKEEKNKQEKVNNKTKKEEIFA